MRGKQDNECKELPRTNSAEFPSSEGLGLVTENGERRLGRLDARLEWRERLDMSPSQPPGRLCPSSGIMCQSRNLDHSRMTLVVF